MGKRPKSTLTWGAEWYRPDWTSVDMLIEPRTRYQTAVVLENGTRVLLPTDETPRILPDKTGVLVIFENDGTISKGFGYFSESDNAAVFNANGSLHFLKIHVENKDAFALFLMRLLKIIPQL